MHPMEIPRTNSDISQARLGIQGANKLSRLWGKRPPTPRTDSTTDIPRKGRDRRRNTAEGTDRLKPKHARMFRRVTLHRRIG